MSKTILAQSGQTFTDIALKYYGCIEGLVPLLQANGLGLNSVPYAGQLVQVPNTAPQLTDTNIQVAQYIAANGNSPNAGVTSSSAPYTEFVEIDYWIDNYSE